MFVHIWFDFLLSLNQFNDRMMILALIYCDCCNLLYFEIIHWWCRKYHQWATRSQHSKESPAQKERKKGPNREHQCGAGQVPSEGQVRTILTTLEC